MEALGMLLVVVGAGLCLIGGIWFLAVAFQESVLWGLGCLIFPLISLIFLIMHLNKAGKPFLIQLAGVVPLLVGNFIMGPQG